MKDAYWVDRLAPFKTPQGDDFWPVFRGSIDGDEKGNSPTEEKIADFYNADDAWLFVLLANQSCDRRSSPWPERGV